MEIRTLAVPDLDQIRDIDSTVEASRYLHVEQGGSGAGRSWRVEERPMREKRVDPNRISEDALFAARQVASGAEDGVGIVTEYDGQLIGMLLALPDPARDVLRLVDVRVDFDFRRQGVGTALAYRALQVAREAGVRAVAAETTSDNFAAAGFLGKLGFELHGVDTLRNTNHDLVRERATLLWYHANTEGNPR